MRFLPRRHGTRSRRRQHTTKSDSTVLQRAHPGVGDRIFYSPPGAKENKILNDISRHGRTGRWPHPSRPRHGVSCQNHRLHNDGGNCNGSRQSSGRNLGTDSAVISDRRPLVNCLCQNVSIASRVLRFTANVIPALKGAVHMDNSLPFVVGCQGNLSADGEPAEKLQFEALEMVRGCG
jgi:hypothetical protein